MEGKRIGKIRSLGSLYMFGWRVGKFPASRIFTDINLPNPDHLTALVDASQIWPRLARGQLLLCYRK